MSEQTPRKRKKIIPRHVIPSKDEIQEMTDRENAQAIANDSLDLFCPISLRDWLELCGRAGVPHVAATRVVDHKRSDYLAWLDLSARGPEVDRMDEKIRREALPGYMMRLDCCADTWVKAELSKGKSEWREEFGTVLSTCDMRSTDIVFAYPRETLPIWRRPWITSSTVDGWPVEYRCYVADGKIVGISNYYPQRPLPFSLAHLRAIIQFTKDLLKHVQEPFLLGADSPPLEGVWFTADFIVGADGRVLFLEGGPPHLPSYGAHPCCFVAGEISGIAMETRWEAV